MKTGLVYLRPARMTYVRVTGPYDTSIPQAWNEILAWLDKNGMNTPITGGYGLARDNPQRVGPENCRYDACVPVDPAFEERAGRELGLITLPAGPYARLRQASGSDALRSVVANVHSSFVAPAELRLDDRRPVVTIYLSNPRQQEGKLLRADVCVPVIATRASRDAAEAA
jgi:AraC family transcriptional regulator